MTRQRSPRYPSFPVGKAIEFAGMLYNGDGKHSMDREVAVRHLGYNSLNGASATALAGLKQFGLIADAGRGMVRLTELAIDILEPVGPDERSAAIREAAFSPGLFASLREKFPDRTPSKDNLRAHLVRQDFTQAAIPSAIDAYLDTCSYVDEQTEKSRFDGADQSAELVPSDEDRAPENAPVPAEATRVAAIAPSAQSVPSKVGIWSETIRLGDSSATLELPEEMTADEFDDFLTWMDFVRARVERKFRRMQEKRGRSDDL